VPRFPLLTDNHVRQPIVEGLKKAGWDVVRAVDRFGQENDDDELLAWAAANGRVFVTCDKVVHRTAHRWLAEGRPFRMIYWWLERYREMTDGDMVAAFEELAAKPDAFAYPIEYIKPKR
jgi:predicted nuclease of predicted toxin-antitoxin system